MSLKPQTNILELFESKDLVKICAPMVRYSKLQFRNLVRQYDCDLVFTPMILADSICKSSKARNNEFTTNLMDTPLVVQFAANEIHDFVGASYLVAPYCDGVDLNCGCPQRWAKEMKLGCEMLKNPQIVYDLVRQCRNTIPKPFTVSVKTRILKDLKRSVEIARQLEHSGVSFLTIHSRYPEDNCGPINQEALKNICESVQVPVVGNGGLTTLEECYELKTKTGIKGVMVANGILTNPELFSGSNKTSLQCIQKWLDICYNSTLTSTEYNSTEYYGTIHEKPHNLTFQCFHHHLVFMLEKVLTRKQRRVFNNFKCFKHVLIFLNEHLGIKPQLFTPETFSRYNSLDTDYSGREVCYNELNPSKNTCNMKPQHDYLATSGKFFNSKQNVDNVDVDSHWSDIFDEAD
ncbi:tRNA-dihydrouridine(20a/20b) synthase [NAD(P)+]-like [Sitophilus oryzae]|uniref:tRNA-dihydrouridine(20a/20b) synthase [NAD(P)+]-like n=1 Tax=Sitophilus oryzae TaxID=7048 RepID=A0A6J2XA83_SITOR|nr:tRNA-dihydrouridine(20a/20b) synthase [NAD(P)+]-like [Sitophilus oryzae]